MNVAHLVLAESAGGSPAWGLVISMPEQLALGARLGEERLLRGPTGAFHNFLFREKL